MVTGEELIVKASVRQCRRCPLWNKEHGPVAFSEPTVSFTGPVRCVQGEAPGQTEDAVGKPFVGSSGKLLREHLPNSDTYHYVNTVCCWPRATPTRKVSDACRVNLVAQLEVIHPDFLLILGSVALQAWWPKLNISAIRGRWFEIPYGTGDSNCWAMATWHPSHLLRKRDPEDMGVWKEDLRLFDHVSSTRYAIKQMLDVTELKKAPTAGMLQGPQLSLSLDITS